VAATRPPALCAWTDPEGTTVFDVIFVAAIIALAAVIALVARGVERL
jgi:hypothetical protein